MRRYALACLTTPALALVLLAVPAGAEMLATVVTGDWNYYEWVEPSNVLRVDPEGYGLYAQQIPFSEEAIDIEVPIAGSDLMPWPYLGEDRDLQLQIIGTAGHWVTRFVSLDTPVGQHVYGEGTTTVTVDRLLPLGEPVPATYTSATWTIDGFARQPDDEMGGFWTQLQFTGRYYIAPEPSACVLCLIGLVHVVHVMVRSRRPADSTSRS